MKKHIVVIDANAISYTYGFRSIEYDWLLNHYRDLIIYATNRRSAFRRNWGKYVEKHPQHIDRIRHIKKYTDSLCFYYMLFLGNVFDNLAFLNKKKHPFVFTCYPGGGFYFDKVVDSNLKYVSEMSEFQGVIATQPNVYEHLIDIMGVDRVFYVYGCIHPTSYFKKSFERKKHYQVDKNLFEICFVARKQMAKGLDKGYDKFIEVACALSKHEDIRFHVVGEYSKYDMDISRFEDKIIFHGTQNMEFFPSFYAKMDMILSPNVPNKLLNGSFDGFPTGACNEAAMLGCPVFCTDELKLNRNFIDKEDLVTIPTSTQEIVDIVEYYYKKPEHLQKISMQGRSKFLEIFDLDKQMNERIQVLERFMK